MGLDEEVGSKRKNMKPMARMAARTKVIGLVRRRDRERAMMAGPAACLFYSFSGSQVRSSRYCCNSDVDM